MPELPEVETIVRDLSKSIEHKTVAEVIVHDDFVLRDTSREDFIRRLKGHAVGSISRRGKAVIIHLSGGEYLIIQLMMTGQLIAGGRSDRHTRVVFKFSDASELLYNDQRRFGRLFIVSRLDQVRHFSLLGPEPFSDGFTPGFMRAAFQKTSRPIKNLLLDHTFVAGIGNIYACEVLFRSRVNPRRQARRISMETVKAIHGAIRQTLTEAITHRGSSMRNYRDGSGKKGRFNERLAVYARQGLPCPRCQKPIQRIFQAGRSTFYCRQCQK